MNMKRSVPGACIAAACLSMAPWLWGEDLLGPLPPTPPPAPPKPADPSMPTPPAAKPPEPVEAVASIPPASKPSRYSVVLPAKTGPGVRIKSVKFSNLQLAFVMVTRWVSNGKWEDNNFSVKKGAPIGQLLTAPHHPDRDFRTSWKLIDIKENVTRTRTKVIKEYVLDEQQNKKRDANGNYITIEKPVPEPYTVNVFTLQHVWAKDKDGKPVIATVDEKSPDGKFATPVLDDFPEDQKPPPDPSEEAP